MSTPLKYTIGILITVGGLFCLLAFGNPQWNKYVYLFQAYLFSSLPSRPHNYSGQWIGWFGDGNVWKIGSFHNGKPHGEHIKYHSNGNVAEKCNYKIDGVTEFENYTFNGELVRKYVIDKDGQIFSEVRTPHYRYHKVKNFGKYNIRREYSHQDELVSVVSQDNAYGNAMHIVFDRNEGIDRRAEFGIEAK